VSERPALDRIPVAILAGGLGTRLRPAIGDHAKVVADVGGRPFLARLLDQVAAAGFRDVVLCVGHRADEVEGALGAAHGPLRLRYSRESEPLGTGGALRLALPLLAGPHVLVLNGDSFCEVDHAAAWSWHVARGSEATLVAVEVPDASRYGRVEIDAADRVRRFAEKQPDGAPGWINAGIYLLASSRIAGLPPGRAVSLERDVLPVWAGGALYGYRVRGRFIDIGTPGAYSAASLFFLGGTGGLAE
jgi:D-glycero-alpha-D-manno-heptose 1-phosphate guanylyltransferase